MPDRRAPHRHDADSTLARGRTTRRTADARVAHLVAVEPLRRQNVRPRPSPERPPSARATRTPQLRTGDPTARSAASLPVPPPATPSAPAPAPEVAQYAAPATLTSHVRPPRDDPSGRTCDLGRPMRGTRPSMTGSSSTETEQPEWPRDSPPQRPRPRSRNTPHSPRRGRTNCRRKTDQAAVCATSAQDRSRPAEVAQHAARTAAPTHTTIDQSRTRNERSRAHAAGVEPRRFELLTSALQRQRSTN